MRKATKIIISFAVVLIAGLNFVVPVFAQDPFTATAIGGLGGASAGGLFNSMASMSGVDFGLPSGGIDPLDAFYNVNNPDYIIVHGSKHEADPVQYPEDIYDYIEVDIGDWLSVQSDFIVNAINQNNIQSNTSGTINNGVSAYNIPSGSMYIYTADGGNITIPGGYEFRNATPSGQWWYMYELYSDGVRSGNIGMANGTPTTVRYVISNGYMSVQFSSNGGQTYYTSIGKGVTENSVIVDYDAGNIDTSVFNDWSGARVKIPHSISGLQSGWTLTDFLDSVNNIWRGAGEDNITIENTNNPPVPPPVPVPDTPLSDVPFDDWVDLWGQGIYEQLENQSDALDFIGSNGEDAVEELESIDTSIQDLGDTAESIDTNIGIGNGILGGIRSLAQSAVNYLEGIAEHVGELVEEIVEGTETLIAGILNQIPQAFSVIFGPIKQASSIWHYVVEWIQSIGAPFQFIWSMASGTSYYVILPVYASLAAAVVLAFFKRFGR